ncbi:MAG: hypothetical protein ACKOC5_04400 [Chloroflexota bacterium]
MGRTLPSITQAYLEEQAWFARFRRALRRRDQAALDALFAGAHQHLAAAAYAAHALPSETLLLAMLLEEHKRVDLALESREQVIENCRQIAVALELLQAICEQLALPGAVDEAGAARLDLASGLPGADTAGSGAAGQESGPANAGEAGADG